MANSQPTDGHIRLPHNITEAIMLRDFSKRQRKILDLILRLSWGCAGKLTATIPHQKDFECVGVHEGHVKKELERLIESKVIKRERNEYSFINDSDLWQVNRNKPYQPEKLTELVSINLHELTKTGSENLPKQEVSPYRNSKIHTSDLASPKESIKENIYNTSFLLARKLQEFILRNNPKAKPKTPEELTKWADDFRKMIEIDKRTPEDIDNVLKFSQDDSFWQTNILSAEKLRKQFDQLYIKMGKTGVTNDEPDEWS